MAGRVCLRVWARADLARVTLRVGCITVVWHSEAPPIHHCSLHLACLTMLSCMRLQNASGAGRVAALGRERETRAHPPQRVVSFSRLVCGTQVAHTHVHTPCKSGESSSWALLKAVGGTFNTPALHGESVVCIAVLVPGSRFFFDPRRRVRRGARGAAGYTVVTGSN